jgi:hypothetical protein
MNPRRLRSMLLSISVIFAWVVGCGAQASETSPVARMPTRQVSTVREAAVPDFPAFLDKFIPILSEGNGYVTREKLEGILGIVMHVESDGKKGFISRYESPVSGEESLNLHEYTNEPDMPVWARAQQEMNGLHSVLNITLGGRCLANAEIKSKLIGVGLKYRGSLPYFGENLALFSDERSFARVFVFSSSGIESFDGCVQSLRIEGNYKGRIN